MFTDPPFIRWASIIRRLLEKLHGFLVPLYAHFLRSFPAMEPSRKILAALLSAPIS